MSGIGEAMNAFTVDNQAIQDLAEKYSCQFSGVDRYMTRYRPKICPFYDLFPLVSGAKSVFDIGCGNGFVLFALKRIGQLNEGIGVDLNRRKLELGNQALRQFGIDAVRLDFSNRFDEWPDRSFQAVTMFDVLHHIPRRYKYDALDAALRRVQPGGVFLYKDMAEKPFAKAAANRLHDLLSAQDWISYVPMSDVISFVEQRGFEKTVSRQSSILWYAHEYTLFVRRQ